MGKVREFFQKNQSNLLVGAGVTGLLVSNIFTLRATKKSVEIIAEKATEDSLYICDYKFKDKFKLCWKQYLPSVLIGVASIAAIIAGMKINNKKIVALGAAYSLSEAMIGEYQRKLIDNVGAKKAAEINQQVSQEVVNKAPAITGDKTVLLTGDGETLFYEPLSGRYFKSSWNKIQEAANRLNEKAIGGVTGSYDLNDWFVAIGLDTTKLGDMLGWATPGFNSDSQLLKIELDSTVTKDNRPCGCIRYINMPIKL